MGVSDCKKTKTPIILQYFEKEAHVNAKMCNRPHDCWRYKSVSYPKQAKIKDLVKFKMINKRI